MRVAVADVVGRVIGFGSRLRHARVFHPAGVVCTAELARGERLDRHPAVAAALFDDADRVVVRFSKGAGTPGSLPDLLGLALRVEKADGRVELLLAGVRGLRMLLLPSRNWVGQPYTTLVPYRADGSLLWLGLLPRNVSGRMPSSLDAVRDALPLTMDVAVARPFGRWQPVGTLTATAAVDQDVWFDPILHANPRFVPVPAWLSLLRQRAYAWSRRNRNATDA